MNTNKIYIFHLNFFLYHMLSVFIKKKMVGSVVGMGLGLLRKLEETTKVSPMVI